MWEELRNRRFKGLKFRRQHPVPPYIVDFFCEESGLVVELDGGQHTEESDHERTIFLQKKGYRVIRFWNNDVLGNIEGVMTKIKEETDSLSPRERAGVREKQNEPSVQTPPHPNPLPEGEGMKHLIPDHFFNIPYRSECYPGAVNLANLQNGANCQRFAYELLRHFGYIIPDFRSRELWEDDMHTYAVTSPEPLDLLLFSKDENCWGAHVAVNIGGDMVLHLSEKNGLPAFETMQEMMAKPEYKIFIGTKRCRIRGRM